MTRISGAVFLAVILPGGAAAAADSVYLGARACAACHPAQFTSQSRAGHAGSLVPAAKHPLAARFSASPPFTLDGFRYGFLRRAGALAFQLSKGEQVREHAVEWAFGAGAQAVTFVSRQDENFYLELRASYYPELGGLALTPGHQNHRPRDLDAALGVRYKTFSPRSEILSCFGCHSTGLPTLGPELQIQPAELGVRCESCHGPGGNHVDLAGRNRLDEARRAIGNPARLKAAELLRFCGECHRPPASSGASIDWTDPWNVRHQPVYLVESACFQRSPGGLTCMGCHDPHQPLRRADAAYYNARCAACHSPKANPPAAVCRVEAGCASCHMPPVKPQPGLTFHNHWIGVYRPGEALRPQR